MRKTLAALTGTALTAAVGAGMLLAPPPPGATSHGLRSSAASSCAVDGIDTGGDEALSSWKEPQSKSCTVKVKTIDGVQYTLPDPVCTPGAVNPTVKIDVLKNAAFRTGPCVRDKATSPTSKNKTYDWYDVPQPQGNTGQNQVCEKDHLVSLELGGADTLDNIWPECGPDEATLNERYFKQKDLVENYLAAKVRSGDIALDDAQRGIATDWTQYIAPAKTWYDGGGAVRNDDNGG